MKEDVLREVVVGVSESVSELDCTVLYCIVCMYVCISGREGMFEDDDDDEREIRELST